MAADTSINVKISSFPKAIERMCQWVLPLLCSKNLQSILSILNLLIPEDIPSLTLDRGCGTLTLPTQAANGLPKYFACQ